MKRFLLLAVGCVLLILFARPSAPQERTAAPLKTPDGSAYSFLYHNNAISLEASNTRIAVIGDSESVRKGLATLGLERDPISDADPLKQRKLVLYQRPMAWIESAKEVEISATARPAVESAGGIIQPVFEQGGALLIPSDEIIVGFAPDSDLATVQAALKPYTSKFGIRDIKGSRKDTYLLTIDRPSGGRAFAVSRELASLSGVTFAEPNFVVVPLDETIGRILPRDLLERLQKPRGAASQTGRKGIRSASGTSQTHESVAWTVLIDEDFEAVGLPPGWSTGRWSTDRADVYWSVTSNRSHRGSRSAHGSSGGPAGVVPPGIYPTKVTSWLETPALDLGAPEEVYIEVWFYGKFSLVDGALVYVREASTGLITTLSPANFEFLLGLGADHTTDPTSDNGWRRALIRIPPAGRRSGSHVGFLFGSDDADGAEGIYIDQVRVVATTDVDTDSLGNDSYAARQYELQNAGQIAGIGNYSNDMAVQEAWAVVSVSPQVVVAVVDSGVDLAHPDLNLLSGYDPDGQVGGWPRYPHGTAVAGNVGAIRNNAIGVMGTAPGVKIMPVFMGADYAEIARAIDIAVAKRARIATNSWGWVGVPSTAIEFAVTDALQAGVVLLFAAGNGPDRPPFTYDTVFPCNLTASSDAICVGASSPSDEYKGAASSDGSTWWGSSYIGAGPDITAPSPWSYTTDQRGADGYNDGSQIDPANASSADYAPKFGGTSSATPKVAGVVALMLSANQDLSPRQVKGILRETADDIDAPGFDDRTGGGRVNAARAVTRAFSEVGEPRVYNIHAIGHPKLARHNNREAGSVIVAVNSYRGPVTGLDLSHFRVTANPVAPFGCEVEITRVVSFFPGRYLLDVVPITTNATCIWRAGRYTIAVLITNGIYSGVGVTDFVVSR